MAIEKYGMWVQVLPVDDVTETQAAGWANMVIGGNSASSWNELMWQVVTQATIRGRLTGKYPGIGSVPKEVGTSLGVNKVPADGKRCVLVIARGLLKFQGGDDEGHWRNYDGSDPDHSGSFVYLSRGGSPLLGTMEGYVRRLSALVCADDHIGVAFGRGPHMGVEVWESQVPLYSNPAKSFEVFTQTDVEQPDFWTNLTWDPINSMHRGYHLRCGDFSCFNTYDPTIAAPEDPGTVPPTPNADLHDAHWNATTSPWRSHLDSPQFHGNVYFGTEGGIAKQGETTNASEYAYSVFDKAAKDSIELIARTEAVIDPGGQGEVVLTGPFAAAPSAQAPAYLPFAFFLLMWKPVTDTASIKDFGLVLASTDSVVDGADDIWVDDGETADDLSIFGPEAMLNIYEALGNPNAPGIGWVPQGDPAATLLPTYVVWGDKANPEEDPYPNTPWYEEQQN